MSCKRFIFPIFLLFFTVFSTSVKAQMFTPMSRTELGLMIGGSHYFGDLNQGKHMLRQTSPAVMMIMRYNIHSRLAFRANVGIGKVYGADSLNDDPILKNRNLSFQSIILEAAAGFELNFLKYQVGHRKYNFTHYILAQIGVFYMNPKAKYNGRTYELHEIGTEGQGSELTNQKRYSLVQMCIPVGLGFKFSPSKRFSIGVEYGIRFTFTDYLDDVKSGTYLMKSRINDEKGPVAAGLSNRSLDQNDYGQRGNPNTKDWYSFFGVTMTFQLGKHKLCVQP